MVDRDHAEISIRRQCQLLGANRSGLYCEPLGESEENLQLMRWLDEQYTRTPFYGSRRIGLRRDATRAPLRAPEWHGRL